MKASTKKNVAKEQAIAEMLARGYTNERKEDRFGETKSGWWCDEVYLGKDPVEALRTANG